MKLLPNPTVVLDQLKSKAATSVSAPGTLGLAALASYVFRFFATTK